MEGSKAANYQSIVFQSRPGSPNLNCCSANAARGVGMLSEWAVMEGDDTVYLNYFGKFSCQTAGGVDIEIDGDYPAGNSINLFLKSQSSQRIAIRIPTWSNRTVISYKADTFYPQAGGFWVADHIWHGEALHIQFDFTPRRLKGDGEYRGKSSIYVGPVLFGYDLSMKSGLDLDHLPPVSISALEKAAPTKCTDGRILLKLTDGMSLCDFYHLGITGSAYKTWFICK